MDIETSLFIDIIKAIGYAFIMLPVVFLSGSFFRRLVSEEDELLLGNLYFALGLGFLGTSLNFLSFFNLYSRIGVIAFSIIILLVRVHQLGNYIRWFTRIISTPFVFIKDSFVFGSVFFLVILFSFLFALLPEIANDALTYHLNIPKELVWQQSTFPLFYDFNSYTPILMNILYGVGLMFESMGFAKLFHWFAGYIFILSVFRISYKACTNRMISIWLALICLLTPTLLNEITSTYVDGAVCLFVLLAFYLFHRGLNEFTKEKSFFISGLLLGFAVSTKIIMLLALPSLLICIVALCIYRRAFDLFLKIFLYMGAGFLLAVSYWFIRNSLLTGNPLYPYLGSIFGGQDFGFVGHFQNMGAPKSFFTYLCLPFHLTFFPEFYDKGYPLGFFLIFILPFSLFGAYKRNEYIYQILFVFIFTSLWYYFFHNIRFLIPVLFLLVFSGAVGLKLFAEKEEAKSGGRIYALTLIFFVLVALMFSYFCYHYRYQFKVITGQIEKSDYLASLERSQILSRWIEKQLPKDSIILNAEENRGLYIPRKSIREVWFSKRANYWENLEREETFNLLKVNGFTHVIRVFPANDESFTPAKRLRWLDGLLNDHHYARKLANLKSTNLKEARFEYIIYELK